MNTNPFISLDFEISTHPVRIISGFFLKRKNCCGVHLHFKKYEGIGDFVTLPLPHCHFSKQERGSTGNKQLEECGKKSGKLPVNSIEVESCNILLYSTILYFKCSSSLRKK